MKFLTRRFSCFFLPISLVIHFISPLLSAEAEWTVLIYAQAKNSLSNFAPKNFDDMSKIGSTKNLNILVQWYQFGQQGIWRYKIEKGKMNLEVNVPTPTDGNNVHDLVDAMQWAVSKYPAKKYCLILWNHGLGILDPVWGNSLFIINPKALNNPRIQIAGLTIESDFRTAGFFESAAPEVDVEHHRGILFNEQSKTYMNNQSLAQALSEIKTKVLNNRKIDVLGMDACLMAMTEIGYQVRDYANYLVGSQEVELAHGWNYATVLQKFSQPQITALDVAKGIVSAYGAHYKDKIQFHTQSAIDLNKIHYLKEALDQIVVDIATCKKADKNNFFGVVKKARGQCVQLSAASYVDLHSFLSELSKNIVSHYETGSIKKEISLVQALNSLKKSLQVGMNVLEDTVIANSTGKFLERAKGLSIYFPHSGLDASYIKTEFAQECLWASFLHEVMQYKS